MDLRPANFSTGTALFDPEKDTPEILFKRLDDTMYEEKRRRHADLIL